MRISLLALAVLATAGSAAAQATLSIPLKAGTTDSVHSETYTCENGESLSVQYVIAGANSLAILPVDGEDRIFVNVVSASGAKYASGADIWWSKGETAMRENELKEGSIETCHATETPPSR